jgi:hypothetical protein
MPLDPVYAQTIKVTALNGPDGHPIADKCMYVWVGNKRDPTSGPLLETQTDGNGIFSLRLTQRDEKPNGESQRLACGLTGTVNFAMTYGDTISIRSGYALCQKDTRDHSWLARSIFSTDEVLQHGVVTANTCGKATAAQRPGELVLFVRPLAWWEKLKK